MSLSLATSRAVILPLQGFAFITTSYRVWSRYRTNRLWWDDFWAFVGLIFAVVSSIGFVIFTDGGAVAYKTHVMGFWMMNFGFSLQVWTARVSLAVALVRINAQKTRMRHAAVAMALLLSAILLFILGQKVVICSRRSAWVFVPGTQNPVCVIGVNVAIENICLDLIADFFLVLFPLKMLWHAKLSAGLRGLILVLFSASILTTLASIPQVGARVWIRTSLIALTCGIQAGVSLTVCNLLIVVTRAYRMFHNGDDMDTAYDYSTMSPVTTPNQSAGSNLTSVHFDTEYEVGVALVCEEKRTITSSLSPKNSRQQEELEVSQ